MGKTNSAIWTFQEIADALSQKTIDIKGQRIRVEVPMFQRGYVWSQKRRQELIRSVRQGLPIGCLVMCRSDSESDASGQVVTTYQLVDGLQRSLTIASSCKNPYLWATEHFDVSTLVNRNDVAELLQQDGNIPFSDVVDGISTFLRSNEHDPNSISTGSLWNALRKHLKISREAGEKDWQALQKLINDLRQGLYIGDLEMPVLLYNGEMENAPKIFELLNQQGQKLSPYQLYAAGWIKDQVDLDLKTDGDIVSVMDQRTKALEEAGYLLEGQRANSLFDVLNAMGHTWSLKYPYLLSRTPANQESPFGFQAAALYHGIRATDKERMQKLPQHFLKSPNGNVDHKQFKQDMAMALEVIDARIGRYLRFKLKAKSDKKEDAVLLSGLQVISATVWVALKLKENPKLDASGITRRFILDAINSEWEGGPIDTRAYTAIWQANEESKRHELHDHYYGSEVKDSELRSELQRWFESQLKVKAKARKSASKSQKLILKLIAATQMNFSEEHDVFEIDHLVSVKSCKDSIKAAEDGWPINAIANLGVLVVRSNREKSVRSIREWYRMEPKSPQVKVDWLRRREQSLRSLAISKQDLDIWDFRSGNLDGNAFVIALNSYWKRQLSILLKLL